MTTVLAPADVVTVSLSLSVVPTLHLSEYNLYQSINTLHTTGHSRIYLDILHPAKIYIWKCTVYKVIVYQKWESTLSLWNELFFKRVISCFVVTYMKHWHIGRAQLQLNRIMSRRAVFYIAKTVQPLVFIAQGWACEESVEFIFATIATTTF